MNLDSALGVTAPRGTKGAITSITRPKVVSLVNRIVLIGRLTADPELRYTQSGVAVAHFTLAVDRPFANQQGERQTDFIDVVVWRNQAESCANYLRKGAMAGVDGRLQIRSYETQDGQRRRVAEVVADRVEFLERARRGSGGPESQSPGGSGLAEDSRGRAESSSESDSDDFEDDLDLDNLPF